MTECTTRSGGEASTTRRNRDDPVTAWRYWQISPNRLLRSVTQRRFEWAPQEPLRARCLAMPHQAPAERCNCGVYGTHDFEALREHGLCLAPEALVVGEVSLWGTVLEDAAGCRGQYGYPARLWLVGETIDDDAVRREVQTNLAAYGVPVESMALEDAVAGASALMLRFQAMSWQASTTGVDATPTPRGG